MAQELDTAPSREAATAQAMRDRFVAFAFAAADLLVETTQDGRITFAAGAFGTRLGRSAESVMGQPVSELVAQADHALLDAALTRLRHDGRLAPVALRLAGPDSLPFALTGMLRPDPSPSRRLALCFAPLPEAVPAETPASLPVVSPRQGPDGLAQNAKDLLLGPLAQGGGVLTLVELSGGSGRIAPRPALAREIEAALAVQLGTRGLAAQLAPGRFGVVANGGDQSVELGALVERLESILHGAGLTGASVRAQAMPLAAPGGSGLTGSQAVRALRLALGTFAQGGPAALAKAGFEDGLQGFIASAGGRLAALRSAIEERRFRLVFQPIVDLEHPDRPPVHYEALLRPLPSRGLPTLGPQNFVCLAEMLGLSVELDLAVLDAALHALRRAGPNIAVAVNVSGLSLQAPGFREQLLRLLETHPDGLPARLLVEATETAEIEDEAAAAETCRLLRGRGIRICVDDFGAGAAGLRYLRALSPDYVKLDGHFISAATGAGGANDRAFAAALVHLARAAGAAVVAERIETEAEAKAVQALGVRYGQGWLFGRPGALGGSLDAADFRGRRDPSSG